MLRSNEANLFLLAKMSSGHTQINLSCGIALSKNIQVIVLPPPQNSSLSVSHSHSRKSAAHWARTLFEATFFSKKEEIQIRIGCLPQCAIGNFCAAKRAKTLLYVTDPQPNVSTSKQRVCLTSDPLTDFQLYRKPHPNRLKETSKL